MTGRQLQQRIRQAISELEDAYYASAGDAFCHWAVQTYLELDFDDALEACNVSGPGDRGLDAFWHDEQNRVVIAAQAKYSTRPKAFDRDAILQLEAAWAWLRRLASGSTASVRDELRAAAERLAELRHADRDYPVQLCCFANGKFTAAAKQHADAFNAEHAAEGVRIELVDLERLATRVAELESRREDPPQTEISLRLQKFFEFTQGDEDSKTPKTVVATVNTKELAEIEREYRYRIFQRNVRYWLRANNRVNKGIARTLSSPVGRANFWYYNNGIAIVCDSVTVTKDRVGHGGVAKVRNLQIVNGCQTTTTLGEAIEHLDDRDAPAYVLVRIFEAADETLQTDISLYNNRQNAVKDRDLLSNDDPQARLQVEFDALEPPWFYERKRGEWDAQVKPNAARRRRYANGGRRIDNEVAAQGAYAFWYDPAVARARKRMLFVRKADDDNGLYDDLFHEGTTPEWLLLPFKITAYVVGRKREFMQELKQALAVDEDERTNAHRRAVQRSWIKFADQFLVGAIRVYLDQVVVLGDHDVQDRLLNAEVFDDMVSRAYALALRDLGPFFRQKHHDAHRRDAPFDPANYVKGNWPEVEAYLRDQWEYRRDEGEDPFRGVALPR